MESRQNKYHYILVIVLTTMIFASCEPAATDKQEENTSYVAIEGEYSKEIQLLNEQLLKRQSDYEAKLTELNKYIQTLENERLELYSISNDYRSDILKIFKQQQNFDSSCQYPFYLLDELTHEQKETIINRIQEHELELRRFEYEKYETANYLGEQPEPYLIFQVLGITEDVPKFYESSESNKTVHLKYSCYQSRISTMENESENATYAIRSFLDGIIEYHIVIELIENEWICVYHGIG